MLVHNTFIRGFENVTFMSEAPQNNADTSARKAIQAERNKSS